MNYRNVVEALFREFAEGAPEETEGRSSGCQRYIAKLCGDPAGQCWLVYETEDPLGNERTSLTVVSNERYARNPGDKYVCDAQWFQIMSHVYFGTNCDRTNGKEELSFEYHGWSSPSFCPHTTYGQAIFPLHIRLHELLRTAIPLVKQNPHVSQMV